MLLNMIGVDDQDDVVALSSRRADPSTRETLTGLVEVLLGSLAGAAPAPDRAGARARTADVTALPVAADGAARRDVA